MKGGKKVAVIIDDTFGFGSRFRLIEVELTEKTLLRSGCKHRRNGQIFAKATRELLLEATAINRLADELQIRARAFRKLLKESPDE